ncbi:unnamed protein product [Brachionus calyciflorus]|uniref:Uncharacterized protein n=1 Tax=Brachionus calyciflorus TaxID=104777 RepID=A0A814E2N9_9BILA|nr:unnamed protein product [Brachionus calyciflorus]
MSQTDNTSIQISDNNLTQDLDENSDLKTNILNISTLLEYFRKLNDYLDQEEEYDRHQRKIRRVIFNHSLLTKKLLPFYRHILSKLNSANQQDIFNTNPGNLLENHKELISNLKLIKTFNELLKLIVDLTTPNEFLYLNHNLIFVILNRFDLIVKHIPGNIETPDFLSEVSELMDEYSSNLIEIGPLIDSNLNMFKDNLIKSEIIPLMGESFKNLIDYYTSISSTFHSQKAANSNANFLKHFKLLKNILFDSLILNLTLIRNLSIDKNETNYSVLLNLLFEIKLDNFLIQLSYLPKLNKSFLENRKHDQRAFVCYCLIVQIMSLLFVKISTNNNINSFPNSDRSESPSDSSSSSNYSQTSDLKLKKNLNKFLIKFCKSESFSFLIEHMVRLLTKPVYLYVYFDMSYFLWLLKFLIPNYALRILRDQNDDVNKREHRKEEAILKRTLINYDLLSFVIFLILESFEQLIFDSNFKNMNLLRLFKLKCIEKDDKNEDSFKKLTNLNSLKLLYLGIGCLYEILDYINYHLELLNSYKLNDSEEMSEFCLFLNEMLHFDELKQLFPLLMRFYCYNQHVFSNSLVRTIFLTNQLYLKTFKNCFELVKKLKTKDFDKTSVLAQNSDTNATKNSSTIATTTTLSFNGLNLNEIYSMYANTHTSYILKHVLTQFVNNDPTLNRCVIDLLDSLMCETNKHEYLFHMNFALALANIATLDNYKLLDQRTKDLVSNMLCGIRRLCKKRPHFANKILFNINCGNEKIFEEDELLRKRVKLETNSGSDPFVDSDSFSGSKFSTCSSSWSSLKSSSSLSPTDSTPESKRNEKLNFMDDKQEEPLEDLEHYNPSPKEVMTELTKELRIVIENEFLFCIRSLDAFKKNHFSHSSKRFDQSKLSNFIIKNDHLYRIFSYLVDLFESASPSQSHDLKVNSWQIYNCLLNMKFSMDDKINYLNEMNNSYLTGTYFTLGINIGFGPFKNDFFKSNECISLRQACSTDEFRKHLKEAYIKYLIDKLCIKSKRTRNAVFWVFNMLKSLKLYLSKKFINMNKNTNELNQLNITSNLYSLNPAFYSKLTNTSSLFQMKLINYYHAYNLGVPLVPFTYELQQVFHSVDFSHLLDILGIIRTNRGFPFIPNDWLDSSKQKLNESLSLMEKCLCI